MKNNYFSRCVLLAGLCSVIMVFAVTPVYATGADRAECDEKQQTMI